MKAQELRIGNLIKIDGIVITVDARTIFDYEHDKRVKEPIPLTEEWLVKLGFDYSTNDGYYLEYNHNDSTYYVEYNNNTKLACLSSAPSEYHFGTYVEIKYVHQIQNLIYCLTGEELTINK